MRAIILFFIAGLVIITTGGMTFFAQREVTDSVYDIEFKHAQDIIDSALLNVSTEYQSLIFFKQAAIDRRKAELKDVVDIAHGAVRLNYEMYKKGLLSEDMAKSLSLRQLKNMRYNDGVGYIWVNDTAQPVPRMVMHTTLPELDGKIMDDPKFDCAQGTKRNLFVAFKEVCAADGSGYVDYFWPKPTADGLTEEQPKISYVKLFKGWNWIIGSGVYMDDVEKDVAGRFKAILKELRGILSKTRVGHNGYIFIFSSKPEMLVHPAYEGADATALINPETGKPLFLDMMKAAHTTGVLEYLWDKPPDHVGEFKFHKRAYIKYFEPLDWYVCSTVYKDELQKPGILLRNKIIMVSLGFLAIAIAFATILSSKIVHPLLKLTAATRAIREGGFSAAEIPVEGPTETKELGAVINGMLDSIRTGIQEKEQLLQALEKGNRDLSATNYQLEIEIAEHSKVQKELLKLRNHQKNILDSMPSLLVGVDGHGHINQWNAGAVKATGYSFEEVSGRSLVEVFPALAAEMDRARKVIRTGRTDERLRIPRKINGETHYENVTVYPLISDGLEGAVIRLDDVTERVRIEEMMIQTEKMMSVGGLAAGMAHEINNPLGGILQGAQNIERRLSPDLKKNAKIAEKHNTTIESVNGYMTEREIFRMLDGIREAATRAANIITNMLNFSRKPDVHRTSCKLNELADKALALAAQDYDLKKKYDFKQIEIIKEYEENLPYTICSPTEIEQVLLNLLGNAAQAMHEMDKQNEASKIYIRIWQAGDYVAIEVEDNGPGMEDVIRKRVFEPFFTTKPKGLGTGLGMSVAYFIITENHAGSFSIESTPGKGSKFTFKIPISTR